MDGPAALVVDDQRWLADALAERLLLEGFHTTVATTGGDALAAATGRTFDLAFVDLNLPDMNGRTAAARLKQQLPGLKLILISGLAAAVDDPAVNSVGADGVLPKPWKAAELADMLRRVLQKP